MDLKSLENLKNLNELDLLYELSRIIQSNYDEAETVVKQKRWKLPGMRLRNSMQDVRLISEIIRDKIQIRKGVKWGNKRKFALDKAIEKEIKRIEKEKKRIEIRRQNRMTANR